MKSIPLFSIVLLFLLKIAPITAQELPEKEVKTEVSQATVFLKGAQVLRKEKVSLGKGRSLLRFTELSPFIDPKGIQLKTDDQVMVLSVNHKHNYEALSKRTEETEKLYRELEVLNEKKREIAIELGIIREELNFLNTNRQITGTDQPVDFSNYQQTAEYFAKKIRELKTAEAKLNKKNADIDKQAVNIGNQIRTIASTKEYPTGEIEVKVEAKQNGTFEFELSYPLSNTSWYPSYDIRAESISEPIRLSYKANLRQDTKSEWKKVKLTFSTTNPDISAVAPVLQPYYLSYGSRPPIKSNTSDYVSGVITDETGEPLPGATVTVEGTTIGTITDLNGYYYLTLPYNAREIMVSYIGMESQSLTVSSPMINVVLQPSDVMIDEVVVTGLGVRREEKKLGYAVSEVEGSVSGVNISRERAKGKKEKKKPRYSPPVPVKESSNPTGISFEVETPYTIPSGNKNHTVVMREYEMPATYRYYAVPLLNEAAYLRAEITDKHKYHLLEGEANIYFENTYVGKTLPDINAESDTLLLSLGIDKSVEVKREKTRDYLDRQFLGNKKELRRTYEITVKNTKAEPIEIVIKDRVPVSKTDEIEVSIEELSKAEHNEDNGLLTWQLNLKPGESKKLIIKYHVKLPKHSSVVLD